MSTPELAIAALIIVAATVVLLNSAEFVILVQRLVARSRDGSVSLRVVSALILLVAVAFTIWVVQSTIQNAPTFSESASGPEPPTTVPSRTPTEQPSPTPTTRPTATNTPTPAPGEVGSTVGVLEFAPVYPDRLLIGGTEFTILEPGDAVTLLGRSEPTVGFLLFVETTDGIEGYVERRFMDWDNRWEWYDLPVRATPTPRPTATLPPRETPIPLATGLTLPVREVAPVYPDASPVEGTELTRLQPGETVTLLGRSEPTVGFLLFVETTDGIEGYVERRFMDWDDRWEWYDLPVRATPTPRPTVTPTPRETPVPVGNGSALFVREVAPVYPDVFLVEGTELTILQPGETVTLLGRSEPTVGFLLFIETTDGIEGYVERRFMDWDDRWEWYDLPVRATSIPRPTITPTPRETPVPLETGLELPVRGVAPVYPGVFLVEGTELTVLQPGERVTLLGRSEPTYGPLLYIETTNGIEGYVERRFMFWDDRWEWLDLPLPQSLTQTPTALPSQ